MGENMQSNNRIEYVFLDEQKRDLVLILPGGGYHFTSPREAMPVAKRILQAGMHAAIFWYRETKHLYPMIKEEGIHILESIKRMPQVKHLFMCGFSAGGHYALMLSIARPDLISKTVLAYPVVSSDPLIRHEGSFVNLLGDLSSPYIDEVSLEKQVHEKLNPIFIMHTADDQAVPVENTLRLVHALQVHNLSYELHIYPHGPHGLSLATEDTSFEHMDPKVFAQNNNDVSGWFRLALNFLRREES